MQLMSSSSLPRALNEFMIKHPQHDAGTPGFIVGVDAMVNYHSPLDQSMAQMYPGNFQKRTPCFVVPPNQVSSIFPDETISAIRAVTGLALDDAPTILKVGFESAWLVYDLKKLCDDWKRSDKDTASWCFEALGVALGIADVAGGAYPGLKLPDTLATDMSVLAVARQSVFEGKVPSGSELLMSTDKRLAVILTVQKVFGIALDHRPEYRSITASPLYMRSEENTEKIF